MGRDKDWLWQLESERDQEEIAAFQNYLADQKTMDRKEFYLKYQDYLQLTDLELAQLLHKLEIQNEQPEWMKGKSDG